MDTAKQLLDAQRPLEALDRLKKLLSTVDASDEWRIHELIGAAFHDLANPAGAAQAYFNAARTDKFLRSQRAHFSNWIFALHYLPHVDAETLDNELAIYNSLFRDVEPLDTVARRGEKISVAFIAPNFCDSSAARFYEPLLTDFDRDKFTVTAWSLSAEEDAFTRKIRRNVDAYTDISETSFEESAIKIRDAGCDVLVDLGGHTEGGATLQVAAYKPCRVQVTAVGYFDSTGLDAIDYFVGDEFLTAGAHFTEKILSLENAFAFRPNEQMIQARSQRRPFPHALTFGCLNNFMKLSDDYLTAVAKILDAVPDAQIIFRDTTPLASRQRALVERLKTFGIERAQVRRGADNFFTDYSEIDLILDAFPYPGGLMTALALYMKVPVLNLRGELASSRTGADILRIANVDELIVADVDAFIAAAIDLAHNRAKLSALTEKISVDKMTDTNGFVADFYAKLSEVI